MKIGDIIKLSETQKYHSGEDYGRIVSIEDGWAKVEAGDIYVHVQLSDLEGQDVVKLN